MQNEIYSHLCDALSKHLGKGSPLDSGNGVRFPSAKKGKATIYHSNIAAGNQAEIAFEAASMAKRLRMGEGEFRSFVAELRGGTGRSVDPNPQHGWTRVGVASDRDASLVLDAIAKRVAEPE